MAETFDPYRKWLGIPTQDQPPHHYRLLGIELFESDPDVIDHAADRQMAHVRGFQSGQNSAASQKLLSELSAARVCLLNAEKKSAYDTQLRVRLSAAQPTPARAIPPSAPEQRLTQPIRSSSVPTPTPPAAVLPATVARPAVIVAREPVLATKRRPSNSAVGRGLWLLAGLAAVVISLAAGFLYRNLAPRSPVVAHSSTVQRPKDEDRPSNPPAKQPLRTKQPLPARQPSPTVSQPKRPSEPIQPSTKPAKEVWLSRNATYTLSSTGDGTVPSPTLLTDDQPDLEFAFHSRGGEGGAHIVIDLGVDKRITRLEIINRRSPSLYGRAIGLQLTLAKDPSRNQRSSSFPIGPDFGPVAWTASEGLAEYQVQLPQPVVARYVKLGFPPERVEFLNLAKVRVYGHEASNAPAAVPP